MLSRSGRRAKKILRRIHLHVSSAAKTGEELFKEGGALLGQDPLDHFCPVVEAGILQEGVEGPHGAGLGVVTAVYHLMHGDYTTC
jgi:hypothetical protein